MCSRERLWTEKPYQNRPTVAAGCCIVSFVPNQFEIVLEYMASRDEGIQTIWKAFSCNSELFASVKLKRLALIYALIYIQICLWNAILHRKQTIFAEPVQDSIFVHFIVYRGQLPRKVVRLIRFLENSLLQFEVRIFACPSTRTNLIKRYHT